MLWTEFWRRGALRDARRIKKTDGLFPRLDWNCLDWLVSYEGFVAKPVAVINCSPRGRHAHESLLEVLNTMSATIVREASVTLPLLGNCMTEEEIVGTPAIAREIRCALIALGEFVSPGSRRGPSFPVAD